MITSPKSITDRTSEGVWQENHRRQTEANTIQESPDIIVRRNSKGLTLHLRRKSVGAPVEGVTIARFLILGVGNDSLTCARYDDDGNLTDESSVSVARPSLLRGPQTRTTAVAGTGGGTIGESIQPAYEVGQDIFAAQDPDADGLTGLTAVNWIDLNVDGRHWRADYRAVCVRVSGVERQMIVAGGAPF